MCSLTATAGSLTATVRSLTATAGSLTPSVGRLRAMAAATDLGGDMHPADVDGFDDALGQRHGGS